MWVRGLGGGGGAVVGLGGGWCGGEVEEGFFVVVGGGAGWVRERRMGKGKVIRWKRKREKGVLVEGGGRLVMKLGVRWESILELV